jgi:hypothetical protein
MIILHVFTRVRKHARVKRLLLYKIEHVHSYIKYLFKSSPIFFETKLGGGKVGRYDIKDFFLTSVTKPFTASISVNSNIPAP